MVILKRYVSCSTSRRVHIRRAHVHLLERRRDARLDVVDQLQRRLRAVLLHELALSANVQHDADPRRELGAGNSRASMHGETQEAFDCGR